MHAQTCPAYGNYQPPYEECTCGAEQRDKDKRLESDATWKAIADTHARDLKGALARIDELEQALSFYADRKHYWLNGYHEPRISDLGGHARAALGRPEPWDKGQK